MKITDALFVNTTTKHHLLIFFIFILTSCAFIATALYGFSPDHYFPNVSGDSIHWLVYTRHVIDSGWWLGTTNALSWPWAFPFAGFPIGGNFEFVLIKFVSLFSSDVFRVIAYALGLSVLLNASISYYIFRLLQCNRLIACAFSIIFSMGPSLYYRNIAHFHSQPYLVAASCGIAILIFTGHIARLSRRHIIPLFALSFALGFTYGYQVAFTLFLFFIALLRQCFSCRNTHKAALIYGCIALVLLLTGGVLNAAPTLATYREHPDLQQKMLSFKIPEEADVYGLYLRSFFRPISPSLPTARLENLYKTAQFPMDRNEQSFQRLGILGCAGLILLLLAQLKLFRPACVHSEPDFHYTYTALGALSLAAIFLAIPGGFGSMINMLSPQIRCYSRIGPYILFFSLAALAITLQAYMRQNPPLKLLKRMFWCAVIGIIMCLSALVDQKPYSPFQPLFKNSSDEVRSGQAMLDEFKLQLPTGSHILTLPTVQYPVTPMVGSMHSFADAVPFLLAKDYKWSTLPLFPVAETNLLYLETLSGTDIVNAAQTMGYDAILYNTRADTEKWISITKDIENTGVNVHKSKDGRYILYTKIAQAAKRSENLFSFSIEHGLLYPLPLEKRVLTNSDIGNHKISLLRKGWYTPETWGTWSQGKSSEIQIPVSQSAKSITLRGRVLTTSSVKQRQIVITANGKTVISGYFAGQVTFDIPIPPLLFETNKAVGLVLLHIGMPDSVPTTHIGHTDVRALTFGCESITVSNYDPEKREVLFSWPDFPSYINSIQGISNAEVWGRWSDANTYQSVIVEYKNPLPEHFILHLAFKMVFGDQNVDIKVGNTIHTIQVKQDGVKDFSIPFTTVNGNTIEIIPSSPKVPAKLGINSDTRSLALGFEKMWIEKLQ